MNPFLKDPLFQSSSPELDRVYIWGPTMRFLRKTLRMVALSTRFILTTTAYGLIRYDQWRLDTFERGFVWLEEWLSLPQRQVEYFLILVYAITYFVPRSPLPWDLNLVIVSTFVAGMLFQTSCPAAIRPRGRHTLLLPRLALQGILWLYLLAVVLFHLRIFLMGDPSLIRNLIFITFEYAVSISHNGQSGRRRKLALLKWKELLGTARLPAPTPR